MYSIPMVDLKGQMIDIKDEILESFEQTLERCDFIKGQFVKEFSDKLGTYISNTFCIPCANGTDALQIALMCLNLNPGDEVITTPFTFVVIVNWYDT